MIANPGREYPAGDRVEQASLDALISPVACHRDDVGSDHMRRVQSVRGRVEPQVNGGGTER